MGDLISTIQTIVQESIKGMKTADMATGTVTSISPVSVKVDQTMQSIPSQAIMLTDAVRTKSVDVVGLDGNKIGTVDAGNGLSVGSKVLMLRVQRGNCYIILSKL